MRTLKQWLYDRFLPAYCRDDLMQANEQLRKKIEAQDQEIQRLNAYIDGMEDVLRYSRVVIHAKEVSAK